MLKNMFKAAAPFIGPGLGAASALASVFGGKKKGTGTPETSQGGFGALPPHMKNGVGEVFLQANKAIHPYARELYQKYGLTPDHPLYNSALAQLQGMNPNEALQQVGVQAPMHAYEIEANRQAGEADFSPEGLAQYMQPFTAEQKAMEMQINKGFDENSKRIQEQRAKLGSSVNNHTSQSYQARLDALENERKNSLAGLAGFLENRQQQNAINLRNQSLGQQANAGQSFQEYQQQELNNANGYNRFINNPNVGQAMGYNQLVAPYLGGSQSTGAVDAQGNRLTRLGGAAMQFMNMNYGTGQNAQQPQYGGYGPQPQQQGRWF